jgi:hypothetical protein
MERHHVLPRSMGGGEQEGNIVLLTVREHYVAHLCLALLGNEAQWFSVECFIADSVNRHRPGRFRVVRGKRWVRRHIAHRRAAQQRAAFRARYQRLYGPPAQA